MKVWAGLVWSPLAFGRGHSGAVWGVETSLTSPPSRSPGDCLYHPCVQSSSSSKVFRAGEMAQQIRVLATKLEGLCLIPRPHMVERKN